MPPKIDPRYRLDPSVLNQYMQYAVPSLIDFSRGQSARGVFTGGQPQAQRSVEDIMHRTQSEKLKVYHGIPIETYKEIGGDPTQSGAFHRGEDIYIREGSSLQGSLGHELGHELYSHRAGEGGVPKLSKYQELDLKLGGWLPSISKYGVRPPSVFPEVKGTTRGREWYNERMRSGAGTGQPYNPEFADAPFNLLNQSILNQLPEEFKTKLSKIKPELDAPNLESRTTLMSDRQDGNVGQALLNLIKKQRAQHGGTL